MSERSDKEDKVMEMMRKAGLTIIAHDIIQAAKEAALSANRNLTDPLDAGIVAVIDKLTHPILEGIFDDERPVYSFRHLRELSEEIKVQLKINDFWHGG